MAKKRVMTGHFSAQIHLIVIVLLLGVLAACGGGGDTTTGVTPPTEALIEPTPLLEAPTEMMVDPTEETGALTGIGTPTDDLGDDVLGDDALGDDEMGDAITLSDIADDPATYLGQTVTVMGEVSAVLNPQVFRVNEGNLLDIGDEILVVHTADQVAGELPEDTNIRVTGTVRNFVQTEIEQDFDFGLEDDLYVEYENRVGIVADSIEPIATVSNIDDDPEAYYGQDVTVVGDVVELVSTNAFQLDDPALLGGDTLLVVGGEDLTVADGQTVEVTGTVRQFNLTDVEGEFGFDLEDELFGDYEGSPVIVATSVMPTADEGEIVP